MAQKINVTLVDDIDGTEAAETLSFGLDGRMYEIDLNKKNADKLRKSLGAYVEGGRRVSGSNGGRSRKSTSSDAKQVREWAKGQGLTVSPRGAIPADVREAYRAAHAS